MNKLLLILGAILITIFLVFGLVLNFFISAILIFILTFFLFLMYGIFLIYDKINLRRLNKLYEKNKDNRDGRFRNESGKVSRGKNVFGGFRTRADESKIEFDSKESRADQFNNIGFTEGNIFEDINPRGESGKNKEGDKSNRFNPI